MCPVILYLLFGSVFKARSITPVKLARTEPEVVDPVDAAPAPVGAKVTPAAAAAG